MKYSWRKIFWRYKALQVNLDHAHTALPTQTSPKPAAHQRYLAVLLLLFALCLLLHVATQCAAHFEVLARISLLFTSSECDLNNEPKLNLFLLSHRLSKHLFPSVPSCTFGSPARAQMKVRGSITCCATVAVHVASILHRNCVRLLMTVIHFCADRVCPGLCWPAGNVVTSSRCKEAASVFLHH